MGTYKVTLISTTVEHAIIHIEANSAKEAQAAVLAEQDNGMGAYDSLFDIQVSKIDVVTNADDENTLRVKKISRLLAAAEYEGQAAVRDLLADLRAYCATTGLANFEQENRAGNEQFLYEWNHGK
jgi:transcriptional regulator of heat shock response